MSEPLLEACQVSVAYGRQVAVHDVDLVVEPGARIGIVGESGSGKTSLARTLLGLVTPSAGEVRHRGVPLAGLPRRERERYRREVQPVFQDGVETLDPRVSIADTVSEGMSSVPRAERRRRVADLLRDVGLDPDVAPGLMDRRPHELSGGQRQRVGIARALAVEPQLLVLDEPTSALDVTVQALLEQLTAERGLAVVLITHNLAVVDRLCDTAVVLHAGRVVERGPTADLLAAPRHPYSQALCAAVPRLGGAPPSVAGSATGSVEGGCAFRLRCPLATERCAAERPQLQQLDGSDGWVACHHAGIPVHSH
jgi:oligopeptide/dipeptide ABC transporter ATP-binding protein